MLRVRPSALASAVLAIAMLALTLDEFSRKQPIYFSWPNAPGVGALILLALVISLFCLIQDTRIQSRARMWAKAAFAMASALPLAWMAAQRIVLGKLSDLPDGPTPEGLVDRMNADVTQMQAASVLVMVGVLVCVGLVHRHRRFA